MLDSIQNVGLNAIVQFDKNDIDFLFEYLVNCSEIGWKLQNPAHFELRHLRHHDASAGALKRRIHKCLSHSHEFKAQISFSMPSMPPKLNVAYERPT